MADLNGLKAANDELGHAAGDQLLRRAGEVLNSAIERPAYAARIGGDEFAILLPETDEAGGAAMIQSILDLITINNTFYPDLTLSLSMGAATAEPGERLEAVVKRADLAMLDSQAPALHGHAARPPSTDGGRTADFGGVVILPVASSETRTRCAPQDERRETWYGSPR